LANKHPTVIHRFGPHMGPATRARSVATRELSRPCVPQRARRSVTRLLAPRGPRASGRVSCAGASVPQRQDVRGQKDHVSVHASVVGAEENVHGRRDLERWRTPRLADRRFRIGTMRITGSWSSMTISSAPASSTRRKYSSILASGTLFETSPPLDHLDHGRADPQTTPSTLVDEHARLSRSHYQCTATSRPTLRPWPTVRSMAKTR
jgi:hypothetical protein